MTTATIITLPHTGKQAVDGAYSVTITQMWEGREGTGYDANIKRGSKVVGEIEQEGRGGMTFVTFYASGDKQAEEQAKWEEFVALWDFPAYVFDGGVTVMHDGETVADTLAFEEMERKRMSRVKNVHVRRGEQVLSYTAKYGVHVQKGDTTFPLLASVLQSGDEVWNKIEWVAVP